MSVSRFGGQVRAMVLALVVLAGVSPASAQQPSAAAVAMAREIIAIKGATEVFNPIVAGVVEQAKIVLLQTNPMLDKPLTEVAARLRKEYAARSGELRERVAVLYAARFSEAELKSILAFYKSPLGKKVIELEPQVIDQSMTDAQAWADKLSEEVIAKFRAEMKKKGHDL
jgi:hypothetical protein